MFVEVTLTKSIGVKTPFSTPLFQTTDILSSIPLQPLGILAKLSLPMLFYYLQKVQLSVAVVSKSCVASSLISYSFVLGSSSITGDMT